MELKHSMEKLKFTNDEYLSEFMLIQYRDIFCQENIQPNLFSLLFVCIQSIDSGLWPAGEIEILLRSIILAK